MNAALRVGFIGLGAIGEPMARRILLAGFDLTVHNRTEARAQPLLDEGAHWAASAQALAQHCDVICLCVSDTAAVEQVVFGPMGIASGGRAGAIVLDLSTIHPGATQQMAERLLQLCGMRWVDSPVSGGPSGARAGTLAAMAGGRAEDVERVRPVLMGFAGKVSHMGAVGCGMATKACNQMLGFGAGAVLAETLNLAARFGLDPSLLPAALAGGFGDSQVLRHYGPLLVDGSYKGNSLTAIKDLDIIQDLARQTGSAIPMTGLVASLHRLQVAQGHLHGGLGAPMRFYAQGPLKTGPRNPLNDEDAT